MPFSKQQTSNFCVRLIVLSTKQVAAKKLSLHLFYRCLSKIYCRSSWVIYNTSSEDDRLQYHKITLNIVLTVGLYKTHPVTLDRKNSCVVITTEKNTDIGGVRLYQYAVFVFNCSKEPAVFTCAFLNVCLGSSNNLKLKEKCHVSLWMCLLVSWVCVCTSAVHPVPTVQAWQQTFGLYFWTTERHFIHFYELNWSF